jgi:transcriptional regulator with XRE-family HTH domain
MANKIPRRLVEYNNSTNEIQDDCILVVDVKESLSQLVRRRAKELNLRNADIARRAGLSRGCIGNIVNETAPTRTGKYRISPEAVEKLAKALEISQTAILEAMDYLSDFTDRTDIDVSPDVRVSVLKKELSPDEVDEIRNAFQVAYQIALQRIAEQKKRENLTTTNETPIEET